MSLQEPARVVLEIRRTQATISGHLAVDRAPASGFFGWLELIDELDRASGPQQLALGCRTEPDPGDE